MVYSGRDSPSVLFKFSCFVNNGYPPLKIWADALTDIVHDDGIQMSLIIIMLKKTLRLASVSNVC